MKVIKPFRKDKYRLYLKWDSIEYKEDGVALLVGATLSGPVLKAAQKVTAPDKIKLDLTPQHLTVLGSYYIVDLSWDRADYNKDGSISIGTAVLRNDHLKTIHKLQQSDYLEIDTEKHEEDIHAFHFVYDTRVVRKEGLPYEYKK
jgi:hypothetical protein